MKKLLILFIIIFCINISWADSYSNVFKLPQTITYHKLLAAIGKMEKDLSGLYITENTEKKVSVMFLQDSELIYADFYLESAGSGTKTTVEFSKSGGGIEEISNNIFTHIDPSYKSSAQIAEEKEKTEEATKTTDENLSQPVAPELVVAAVASSVEVASGGSGSSVSLDETEIVVSADTIASLNVETVSENVEKKRVVKVMRVEKLFTPEELYDKEYKAGYSAYMSKDYDKSYKHYKSALVHKNDDVARIWAVKAGLKVLNNTSDIKGQKTIHSEMSQIINQIDYEQLTSGYKKGYTYLQSQLSKHKPGFDNTPDVNALFDENYKKGYSMYKSKDYEKSFDLYKKALSYKSDDIARIWAIKSGLKVAGSKSGSTQREVLKNVGRFLEEIDVSALSDSYQKGYKYLKGQYDTLNK